MSTTTSIAPVADPVVPIADPVVPIADPVVPIADPDLTKKTSPDDEEAAITTTREVAPAEHRKWDYVFATVVFFILAAVGGISGVSIKYSKKGKQTTNNKPNKQQKPDYDINLNYSGGGAGSYSSGTSSSSGYGYSSNNVATSQQQNPPLVVVNNNNPSVPAQEQQQPQAAEPAADPLRVVVFGKWYDFTSYAAEHPGGSDVMWKYNAWDMSDIWPRTPPGLMNAACLNSNKYLDLLLTQITPVCVDQELPCHNQVYGTYLVQLTLAPYYVQDYFVTQADLDASGRAYVIIDGYLYDFTVYTNSLRDSNTNAISSDPNHPHVYLESSFHNLILSHLKSDATDAYYQTYGTSDHSACLTDFYYARLDAS